MLPGMRGADVVSSTFAGLLAPRRLVPILAVGIPIVAAQSGSASSFAIPVGASMVLGFLLIGPLTYRLLFGGEQRAAFALRALAYIAVALAVIACLGIVVPRLVDMRASFLTYPSSLLVSLGLFLVGGFGLGHDIETEHELERGRSRARELVREAEHAQLLAMRSHLDPHFLFNTLNAIAEWCREDGAAAEQAILELASMLRTVLDGLRTPSWPVSRDMELARALGRLYAARDAKRFRFEADVDEDALAREIPAMITLPLIENAWKHGPSRGHDAPVRLSVRALPRTTVIRVENGGAFEGPRAGGEGLAMVTRRLEVAYQGHAHFEIGAEHGMTVATLFLPHAPEAGAR
jgi:two-component system sensor histidine kinase AlgZ